MIYKIYTKGNFIYFEDENGDIFEGLSKDVFFRRKNINSTELYFSNVNGLNTNTPINISNIRNENNETVTLSAFVSFLETSLGNNIAGTTALTTGWGQYTDTQFTQGSPFSLAANTLTDLPNNAGNVLEIQKPSDIDTFYDPATQTIKGRNGDGLAWAIELKVVPSVASDFVELSIDIGGSIGEIYKTLYNFPKGAGVVRNIIYAIPSAYTLDTWQSNGGKVKVFSNGSCDIYGIRYVLTRTHKAV